MGKKTMRTTVGIKRVAERLGFDEDDAVGLPKLAFATASSDLDKLGAAVSEGGGQIAPGKPPFSYFFSAF